MFSICEEDCNSSSSDLVEMLNDAPELREVLREQKDAVSKVKSLAINSNICSSPEEMIRKFFPNINSLTLRYTGNENISLRNIVGGRNWKSFKLKTPKTLDDNFLTEVIVNCKEAIVDSNNNNFTMKAVFQLLGTCLTIDPNFNRKFSLGKIVDADFDYMMLDLSLTPVFYPGIILIVENDHISRVKYYTIRFENGTEGSHLRFSVPMIGKNV